MHGADGRLCHSAGVAAAESRNAEVGHLDGAVLQQHNVLRLDVPVHDALVMGMLQCTENLRREMNSLPPFHYLLLLDILF